MKRVLEYVLLRPLSACFQGIIIGVLLPLTFASQMAFRSTAGRVAAWLLAPMWLVLILLAIPVAIVYCLVMVTWKGPYWQYPPDRRHSFRPEMLDAPGREIEG